MVLNFPQNGIPNQADPELINAWLEEGFQLHQAGQLDQAIALYQRVLKADPKNVEALYLSGAVNVMRENYLEAVIQLSSALKTDPDFAPAYGLLGEAQKTSAIITVPPQIISVPSRLNRRISICGINTATPCASAVTLPVPRKPTLKNPH